MGNILNILHLSDLHFGRENTTMTSRRGNVLDRLIYLLKEEDITWKPHLLVVSGDIAWKGEKEEYKYAAEWLKKLLETLGLKANEFISCPGNHDIDLKADQLLPEPSNSKEADEFLHIENSDRFSLPFKNYISFCQEMGMVPLSIGKESSYLIGVREFEWMRFIILNSAWFCRGGKIEKLWIGLPHLQLMDSSGKLSNDRIFTTSILHHPCECLRDEEITSYGTRLNTYQYLARNSNLILSGHVHGVLKEHDQKYGHAFLFTGGSSYSSEGERNNFSIFQVDREKGTIQRRPFEFDPADGSWEKREKYRAVLHFKDKKPENLEDIVIYRFPYPIASLFQAATNIDETEKPVKKLNAILSTAEAIARFLGIIAVSEIIRTLEKDESLPPGFPKEMFLESLMNPTFSSWVEISRVGFNFLAKHKADIVVPRLNFLYFNEKGNPTKSDEAFRDLEVMKVGIAEKQDPSKPKEDKDIILCRVANKLLTTIIENLLDFANLSYGLIHSIELKKNKREKPVYFYKGKNLGGQYFAKDEMKKLRIEPFQYYKETDAVILKFEECENYLNLFPFYIYEEINVKAKDIFYYKGINGKRILYCGCGEGGEFEIDNNLPENEEIDWKKILEDAKKEKIGRNAKRSTLIENELNYIFHFFR